jgi:hypothetical protein
MASKVEELRKEISKMVDFMSPYDMEMMRKRLTRLVAAAEAQGFARGVAEERARIVRGSERLPEGTDAEVSEYFGIAYGVHEDNVLTNSEIFIVPASLLAPDKESDDGNKETAFDKAGVILRGQHGMDW